MYKRSDGVHSDPGLGSVDAGDGLCSFCGGEHDKFCPQEWAFYREVKAADERLHGKGQSWREQRRSVGGKAAADDRDRGRAMAHTAKRIPRG